MYLESWVATTVYASPYPTAADVWPDTSVQSLEFMPQVMGVGFVVSGAGRMGWRRGEHSGYFVWWSARRRRVAAGPLPHAASRHMYSNT